MWIMADFINWLLNDYLQLIVIFGGLLVMGFKNKTVLIAGGGGGIGLQCAVCFAKEGANVAVADISEEALNSAKKQINNLLTLCTDVRNFDQVKSAVEKTVNTFGRIDILINCVGGASSRVFGVSCDFCDFPIDAMNWGIDVNLKGTMYFCHEAMRYMRDQKSGVVINLGSISGAEGSPSAVDYSASKSAIMNGLNKSLAMFGAQYGIRVNCVSPGPVLTRPTSLATLIGRPGEVQEIVDLIMFVASDKAQFITGANYMIDGGRSCLIARAGQK